MKIVFLSTIMLFVSQFLFAQSSIVGLWKTIDDETGKEKSVVEIYQKGDLYYGKVIKLFREPDEDQNPICDKCDEDDERYNQPVIGMEIIQALEQDGDEFEDGTIIDPENGSVYDCKLWIEDGQLQVRGYISFLYRTQTWLKYVP